MRRIFLCIVFLCLTHVLPAQDIIITTDAKKIESTIFEVSKTEIKYKDFANPNGPTFVLSTDEISSVIYANGQVQLFSSSTTEKKVSTPSSAPVSEDATSAPVSTSKQTTDNSTRKGRIFRDNNEYMYNDTYISAKEVGRILKRENSTAYEKWRQGKGMEIGGAVCMGVGGGLIITGLGYINPNSLNRTLLLNGTGLVATVVGLGVYLGASGCYNKAIDIYNSSYDEAAVRLNFQVGANGVGLALNF